MENKIKLLYIKDKFSDEVESISKYVNLVNTMQRRIGSPHIMFHFLRKHEILNELYNENLCREIYDNDKEKIIDIYIEHLELINNKINKYDELLNSIKNWNKIELNDESEEENKTCVKMFRSIALGNYYDEIKCKSIDGYKQLVEDEFNLLNKYTKDDILDIYNKYDNEKIQLIKNTIIQLLIESDRRQLIDSKNYFESLNTTLKINDQKNILNSYRQGFILLIANFDATIFDMVNILLDEKFFEYISNFNSDGEKKVNLKIDDIVSCQSFDGVKEEIITRTLKGKYIKDILEILSKLEVEYIKQNYADIMECMNRRNIHLHKSGIVDKKYHDKFNIFGFEIGQIATINEDYFINTIDLCKNATESIYRWIDDKI